MESRDIGLRTDASRCDTGDHEDRPYGDTGEGVEEWSGLMMKC